MKRESGYALYSIQVDSQSRPSNRGYGLLIGVAGDSRWAYQAKRSSKKLSGRGLPRGASGWRYVMAIKEGMEETTHQNCIV